MSVTENLLRKYIDHVWQAEGINFIDRIGEPMYSDVEFTDEEKATLTRLADDIAESQ
jgi:hypothetical protein